MWSDILVIGLMLWSDVLVVGLKSWRPQLGRIIPWEARGAA